MSSGSYYSSRSVPRQRALPPEDAPEPRTRRWGGLAIVLGALSGIVICGLAFGVLYLINGRTVSPDGAAQSLCADLQAQNYTAAYELLAPALQHEGTAQQFALSQRQLDIQNGKVVACVYTVSSADSAQASLNMTVTRKQSGTSAGVVHFQYLSGAWKVASYDTSVI